jgi:hypothetical protein
MTKAELIQALNEYDDNDNVLIGLEGFDEAFEVDALECIRGDAMLVSELIPTSYEVRWLAEMYYDYRKVSDAEKDAFNAWKELL